MKSPKEIQMQPIAFLMFIRCEKFGLLDFRQMSLGEGPAKKGAKT